MQVGLPFTYSAITLPILCAAMGMVIMPIYLFQIKGFINNKPECRHSPPGLRAQIALCHASELINNLTG